MAVARSIDPWCYTKHLHPKKTSHVTTKTPRDYLWTQDSLSKHRFDVELSTRLHNKHLNNSIYTICGITLTIPIM